MEWRDLAICAGTDSDIFFNSKREDEAREYCDRCPVAKSCLNEAMDFRSWGVWSGTTLNQRRYLRERERRRRDRRNTHRNVPVSLRLT